MNTEEKIANELKDMIYTYLEGIVDKNEITSEINLFGDGIGLDSIDALEIAMKIRDTYKIKFKKEPYQYRNIFKNISTLSKFITENGRF